MLSKKFVKEVAKLLKLDEKTVMAAYDDKDEKDIDIPEGLEVFTEEELETRDQNNIDAGKKDKTAREEAVKQGKELAIKAIKKEAGITDADVKDEVALGKKIKEMQAGDEAIKGQVEALQKDKLRLEKTLQKKERELSQVAERSSIRSALPKNLSDALTVDEHAELVQKHVKKVEGGYEFEGQLLRRDKDKGAMSQSEAYQWFYENKRKSLLTDGSGGSGGSGGGGRGDGDDKGGGTGVFKTLKDVQLDFKKKNPEASLGSIEFSEHLESVLEANKGELDYSVAMEDD